MAQSRGEDLLKQVPHLDLVAGTQKYHRVVDNVVEIMRKKEESIMDDLRVPIVDIEEEEESQNTIRDHVDKDYGVKEFVSIMQGCNMKCTFCIVPYTRGAERSRPISEIIDECKRLADNGVREVTLLGQTVNLFGRHEFDTIGDKGPFVQLLEQISEIDGIKRIRFTSPHPIGYKQDLINGIHRIAQAGESRSFSTAEWFRPNFKADAPALQGGEIHRNLRKDEGGPPWNCNFD